MKGWLFCSPLFSRHIEECLEHSNSSIKFVNEEGRGREGESDRKEGKKEQMERKYAWDKIGK